MKRFIFFGLLLVLLEGCNGKNVEYSYPQMVKDEQESKIGSIITGDEQPGVTLFGGENRRSDEGVGANSLLWQASLDVVNFMPIEVSDYGGGVISTGWYNINGEKGARYKITVNIRGKQLAATSLKIVIFKQIYQNGTWHPTKVDAELVKDFEMKILNRARELKLAGKS